MRLENLRHILKSIYEFEALIWLNGLPFILRFETQNQIFTPFLRDKFNPVFI